MKNSNEKKKYYCELVMRFHELYGDIPVPSQCKIDGIQIGNWVHTQIRYYNKGLLTEEEIKMYEEAGIDFDPPKGRRVHSKNKNLKPKPISNSILEPSTNQQNWEKHYLLAKLFYEEYHHLIIYHTYMINDFKLGIWIQNQRIAYKDHKLTSEQIKLLEAIGMVWNVKKAKREGIISPSVQAILKKEREERKEEKRKKEEVEKEKLQRRNKSNYQLASKNFKNNELRSVDLIYLRLFVIMMYPIGSKYLTKEEKKQIETFYKIKPSHVVIKEHVLVYAIRVMKQANQNEKTYERPFIWLTQNQINRVKSIYQVDYSIKEENETKLEKQQWIRKILIKNPDMFNPIETLYLIQKFDLDGKHESTLFQIKIEEEQAILEKLLKLGREK